MILLCFINYCTWVHCLSPHTHTHTHLHTHTMAITQTHKHTHTQTNGQIQLQFPGLHCCVHFSLNCTQLRTGIKREEGSVQESEEKRKSGKERRKRHYSNHKISALTHRQRHPQTHTHIAKSIKIQKHCSPFANNKRNGRKKENAVRGLKKMRKNPVKCAGKILYFFLTA